MCRRIEIPVVSTLEVVRQPSLQQVLCPSNVIFGRSDHIFATHTTKPLRMLGTRSGRAVVERL